MSELERRLLALLALREAQRWQGQERDPVEYLREAARIGAEVERDEVVAWLRKCEADQDFDGRQSTQSMFAGVFAEAVLARAKP